MASPSSWCTRASAWPATTASSRRRRSRTRRSTSLVALAKKIDVDGDRRRHRAARRRLVAGLWGVRRSPARRAPGRLCRRPPGDGRHERRAGPGRRWPGPPSGRRRPDLPDGLRLSLRGVRGRRLGADGSAGRRGPRPAWSLDLYAASDVPVEQTILGLPLYGMRWRVAGPGARRPAPRATARSGSRRQPEVPGGPAGAARVRPDRGRRVLRRGAHRQPRARRFARDGRLAGDLRRFAGDADPKLALADARGLAGVGFWAIGYERGLPGYTDLIARFKAGKVP